MGGGHAGWDVREWVPLCYKCHEILDHRQGKHEDWVKVHHWIEINLERGEWP